MATKGDISLQLDLSALEDVGKDLEKLQERLDAEVGKLAFQTHAHIVEQAQIKLRSRREIFLKNLAVEKVSEGLYVIIVKQAAVWIEEGMPPHSMVDDLLRQSPNNPNSKPAKTAKDGSKYRVIPFEQNKAPTRQTPAAQDLTQTIKDKMRQLKIPFGKVERDDKGKPKMGLLHAFNINDKPLKTAEGPGQGHGPVGAVKQGPTGIPFLHGVRVYQSEANNPNGTPKMKKNGERAINRSVMTFRVVSSKHKAQNRWYYPGIEGMGFLDDAYLWAETQWEQNIVPDILKSLD